MATEADVPEAISVMKGEGEERYLKSEQFDKNVEQCLPVELIKSIGEPIQHPEMEKPCAVSENVQVESSALVDSKNNGFGISEGEHFLEPLSDISQADDQSNQAGLVREKTQDANVEVEKVELASKYETDVDEHVQVSSNEEDSNKENIPCLEKEAESSQKDVEGEEMADENAGMYRKEASALQEATAFQEHEAPISNLDLANESFKKDTELETDEHKTTGSDPILEEETCTKITSDIGEDSQQTAQEYELDKEPQNPPEVMPEDAKTESKCENAEVIAYTKEERAVQNTQEYSEKNEPDLVHSTEENGNISEVFKATTEEQETEEHALPEIQNAEEETRVSSFKEEEKEADEKCEELIEVTDTTKETESETVEQRMETSEDLDVPIPVEEAYAAKSTKACDQNYSSFFEESEVKAKEIVQEDHSAVNDYGLVSEEVGAEAESKELVENNPEEKDSETIVIDEQAEDGLKSKEIIEKEIQTPEDEAEKDLKKTEEENKDPVEDVMERQIPAAADESEEGKIDEQVTYTDITSEEKGLETIVTDEGETCVKEAEEKNSREEKAIPILISADETSEVELQAEEDVTSKENLERQTPTIADEGDTCVRDETTHVEDTADNTADITPEEKCLAIVADEDDKGLKEAEEGNKEQITSRDISSEDKGLPTILTDEMAAENEGVELQADENADSKESLEENPAATEKGDTCVKEADEEKAPATILTDDKAEAIDYAGAHGTENSNSKEILEEQIPSVVYEGETDLKEAEAEIKEEEGATDYAPEQKDAETINISRDKTSPDLEDIQEQENSTMEESLESQTPAEVEGETCMKEGEAENMEKFTSAGIAAKDKGLSAVLSDEPAKDIEDIQAEEKQFPKEAGEGEEKASHGNINVDDTSVNVYSTELEEAGPELRVEDNPEKNHTIVEVVLNEPKIISRDFSEEQIVEGHAAVISPESVGEDTAKNDQYDEKEENASEISRGYIPEQFIVDKCDEVNSEDKIIEDSQTVEVDESCKCETKNVENSEDQFSTLPVRDYEEESPQVLEKYEPEEEHTKLPDVVPEQTKPESSMENAEAVSYTKEETQESLEKDGDTIENDTSIRKACIEETELSTEGVNQTPSSSVAEGETGMKEGEAENMEQLTSVGIAAEEKDLSDEPAKDIEDIQVEEKQIPKEAGEGEEKVSHNVDDTSVNVYSTELEEARPKDHPEKNHTISEEVFDEPKITTRDFSEEQIIEGNAVVITPESVGEDTIKNHQDDEKETESIKEEIAGETSPEDATVQLKDDDKCDALKYSQVEILEDSQTVDVDESTTCETTTNVEKSEEQFSTLPVKSEESPLVLEKYEPAEEGITKLPEQTKPESSVEDDEDEGGVAESSTEQEIFETSLQEVEKTEDHEECKETIEGTREAKFETSDDTTEVVEAIRIAALENKDNEATDVQEDEYFNSNDNFEKQIPTVAEGEEEQKSEVEDLPEKNNKICEEVVDEPNIIGRDSTVTKENATNPTEEEAITDYGSTQNITEGDAKDISPEYVWQDSQEKYSDCIEEAFETTGEACNEAAEPNTEAKKEETVEDSSKEEKKEGHEVCEEATEAKSDILEDTTEPKPILEEESKKSLDEDSSISAQESEKEREKEIEGEYTSTVRNIDSEVLGGEIGLKEANSENEDLVESSHIASVENENEGTGLYDTELVSATTVEAVEEEAEPKLEVANESEKSDDQPEKKNNICEEVLDEPKVTYRDFNEEKLTQGSVVNFATESSVEETVTNCEANENETEKVNNEGSSIENIKEGDDGIITTEYAREDSDEKLKECTQEEVESKEEILHESQTIAPEEKIIGSSEVVHESVPESIDEISQDEITAEQTTLDEVISEEPSTLLSEEKELADSEHEHKNIEETFLPKEEPRELTYPEMADEKLGDGETEEPIKETCGAVPVSEPRSIGLVSKDGIITEQTHCDGAADTPEEEIKDDSAVKTSDSESISEVSKEEIITQAPVFSEEHETRSVDKSIEEEEVPKEAQVPADEKKPEVTSEEPSALLSEEKELVDSKPEHKNIEEEQAKDVYVPTEKDTGVEETLLPKEETRELTFTEMADDKLDAGETEEPTENTSESVLVSEPRSIGLVPENEIITDQAHNDGENDTLEEDLKDESAVITKCDSESTDEVSKEENIADQTLQEDVTMEHVSTEETKSVDKNIEEEEVSKEARVPADEEKPEEKCLQIEEPKDSDLAEKNSDAAETDEEIKRTVETVTEPKPETIIVASGDETVADQTVCEGITDTPLSTATDLDTSEMVSKSDSGSIEVVSSDDIIPETKEQLQSPSSALLLEETEREVYEPDDEKSTAQGTNEQECTKEFEVSADQHNQASLAADSVEEEKCLQKEETSEEITADETLSNKKVIDTPIETPPYTSLHEERELEACELDSETKEGSDVIPQSDSQSSHEVSAERSIEEASEVTSISREAPEATQILDQGEEHTQVETSEVADEIKVRESQLSEEVKASDNVGLEKLESELVPESDCKTVDMAAQDEVIAEQTLDEGTTNEQLQIPSSTLLSDEKELEVSELEATTADKNLEEEQAAEVYVPTEKDKSVEETLLPKEEPRELKVSESALEQLDAGDETKEETTGTSETVLVSEPQSIGAVSDDEIFTDETQCDDEKELTACHETLDANTTDSALVPKCDSVSTDDVSKDEIIAEQTVEEYISREQLQIPSSALLADKTMLKASDHEHETTCVDKSIDEVPCLQTEEAKDPESTLEKLEAGKTEDETKETFAPVTQLESESIAVASGEETAADHNVCEGVVVDTPPSIAREFDTSELHMEKPEAEDTEEDIKVCPESVSNIDSGSIKVVSSDEIIAETKEQIQSPSSTLLPEEKEREASEPEDETTPQVMNTQDCIKEVEVSPENKNLKEEVEEPTDEATQETEGVKETYETVSNSDCQSTDTVSKDDTTADQTHVDEIKEALEKQDAEDATEEVKEVSEVTPRSDLQSVPAKDEFIADQVSEENELKESDNEYGTAIQIKATEKEPAEEIQVTDVEDTEEPRWLKLSELLAENINAGEIEEKTKEASETTPEVSSRSIGELSREEIADQIPPVSSLTKEKSYENTTTTDNAEEKSMNVVEEISVPDEEQTKEASETEPEVSSQTISELLTEEIADQIPPAASLLTEEKSYKNTTTTDNAEEKSMNVVEEISVPNELNVSALELHSSQDTQKSISAEVNPASNEEMNLEVATSGSMAEDCTTTTEANEAAKIKISNEEIKDEEELPKDSQLISVDQENIKESQEESEPREERYAEERKDQFNTAPSFKDYEVPEVKLDDTASKDHSPDEAEGIKSSKDKLIATEAIEEKSSESGVETTDAKSTPVSLSECLMDETTKESKEVVTHLPEEKEHADEEEDDQEHVEEAKTDEEKEEDTEHNGTSHGYDEPVILEASRDSGEVKVSPKKSHNILSGMGSKVKHSISRVRKAIIGKSSNSKTQSEK